MKSSRLGKPPQAGRRKPPDSGQPQDAKPTDEPPEVHAAEHQKPVESKPAAPTEVSKMETSAPAVEEWLQRDIWLLEVALDLVRGEPPGLIYAWPMVKWAAQSSRIPPRSFYISADGVPDIEIALGAIVAGTLDAIEVEADLSRMGLTADKHYLVRPRVFLEWVASKGYRIPVALQRLLTDGAVEAQAPRDKPRIQSAIGPRAQAALVQGEQPPEPEVYALELTSDAPGEWKPIDEAGYKVRLSDKSYALLVDGRNGRGSATIVRPVKRGQDPVRLTFAEFAVLQKYVNSAGKPLHPQDVHSADGESAKRMARKVRKRIYDVSRKKFFETTDGASTFKPGAARYCIVIPPHKAD